MTARGGGTAARCISPVYSAALGIPTLCSDRGRERSSFLRLSSEDLPNTESKISGRARRDGTHTHQMPRAGPTIRRPDSTSEVGRDY